MLPGCQSLSRILLERTTMMRKLPRSLSQKSRPLSSETERSSNYASTTEKPLKSAQISDNVQQWDDNFVAIKQDLLFELILVAHYMDIKPLLDLICTTVESMINDTKTLEKICKI